MTSHPYAVRSVLAAMFALSLASAAPAQPAAREDAGRAIVIGQSYALASTVLGDLRRINVYLPDHYADPTRTFPVLFLLDGGEHEDFHHVTGLAQINAAYGQGQELIVVGIEGVDRKHDLTSPATNPADRKRLPTSGGADDYRRFLKDELKPWVAARYRTNGHSALMGESLAGLFVAETLLREPSSFDDYVIVSPSLWWNQGGLAGEAKADLQRAKFAGARAWIAFDDPPPPAEEAQRDRARQDRLEAAFREADPPGLTWTVTRPGETHGGIYHPAILRAFRALYGPPAS
ncbi:alpha/beta hydrolase [Phenylobacterium aquaticum]|uniref:alpha/beta hydrolase n=1 Tax=Phenylobacterium aquaticum TaxID=1763816 RepID=UPI0026EBB356|nr:alpha/beta hydrolase-fold protein [Phenylobacterium aquaticum]